MLIRDIMTTNVVSISSTMSLAEARGRMNACQIKHLPVVDKAKLVGIVTRRALEKAGPSELTTFSKQELNYLLNRLTVKEVMNKDLVTISPDATVEEAVALARLNKTRSFLVMDNNQLVGIVTNSDFFYKVLNPMLDIKEPDTRVLVHS
jgi:acetoin utilization protein AcuB